MTGGPDCAVMCNLINTRTRTQHTTVVPALFTGIATQTYINTYIPGNISKYVFKTILSGSLFSKVLLFNKPLRF